MIVYNVHVYVTIVVDSMDMCNNSYRFPTHLVSFMYHHLLYCYTKTFTLSKYPMLLSGSMRHAMVIIYKRIISSLCQV